MDSVRELEERASKVENLVVYFGQSSSDSQEFKTYQSVAHDFMQDDHIEFVHVESGENLAESDKKAMQIEVPKVRVYRYRHGKNFKELGSSFTAETLRTFVIHSTFTGITQGLLRELSTETAMTIFQYNLLVIFLFRNTSDALTHTYYEKEF